MPFPVCPKCRYERRPEQTDNPGQCPACGLIFSKWMAHQQRQPLRATPAVSNNDHSEDDNSHWREQCLSALTRPASNPTRLEWLGRSLLWLLLLGYGVWLMTRGWRSEAVMQSFMHSINLPIHEAGHVFFSILGEFMMVLGGSLFQCLLPLGIAVAFVWKQHNPFGGAVALWWTGQSCLDVAPYIGDARAMDMPLIGEYTEEIVEMRAERHDWHRLLEWTGQLQHDAFWASLCWGLGCLIMLLALGWGAYLLKAQHQQILEHSAD